MIEVAEIELRYYDQKIKQSWIIDCVMLNGKVLPAWEFRSNFAKSKTNDRLLDLYYDAKVPAGTYVCRFAKNGSLTAENFDLQFFLATKHGLVKVEEVPSEVEISFSQNVPY